MAYLLAQHVDIEFPTCVRDDLRYVVKDRPGVMVEVKPTDVSSLRFAIRTAIGQLLDYRQNQGWMGPQLIVVETRVVRADDLRLAFDNGFGLAWPSGKGSRSFGRTGPAGAERSRRRCLFRPSSTSSLACLPTIRLDRCRKVAKPAQF